MHIAPYAEPAITSPSSETPAESAVTVPFDRLVAVLGIGLFVIHFGMSGALGKLPIALFLKDRLHEDAAAVAAFGAICGIPLYAKPLFSLIADAAPPGRVRRRGTLLVAAFAGVVGWLLLGVLPTGFGALLGAAILINAAAILAGSALGGILVEEGQRLRATGRLAAVRVMASGAAAALASLVGGALAARSLLWTGAVGAGLFALLAASVLTLLRQPEESASAAGGNVPTHAAWLADRVAAPPRARKASPIPSGSPSPAASGLRKRSFRTEGAGVSESGAFGPVREIVSATQTAVPMAAQMRAISHAPPLWIVLGVLALVLIAPGFGTPLLYYQTDVLHFPSSTIGRIGAMGISCGAPGPVLYALLARKQDARRIFTIAVAAQCVTTLLYAGYHSVVSAVAITGANNLVGAVIDTAALDLVTRATPRTAAALGFAVASSTASITSALSDVLGSALYAHAHLSFLSLIWVNAGTTALALPALRMLPRSLTAHREGEAVGVPPHRK